jgi:selenide,water dikinase
VGAGAEVLVGADAGDDAGVYLHRGTALVATADFITPVCDDPRRFGRIAATNSLSDVFAMGGEALFGLNLCCFPESGVPDGVLGDILRGAADALADAGAALLGGHSVRDEELKFGLAVIGHADPKRLLTNDKVSVGDRLILTKPLGTGVLVNAFKFDRLDEEGLEEALQQMERLNLEASRQALEHGVQAATDVTGFGLAGHALNLARPSGVRIQLEYASLPVLAGFFDLVARGVTTGCTEGNETNVAAFLDLDRSLSATEKAILFDPQTSGGLLLAAPADRTEELLAKLIASGHSAAIIGQAKDGPPGLEVV